MSGWSPNANGKCTCANGIAPESNHTSTTSDTRFIGLEQWEHEISAASIYGLCRSKTPNSSRGTLSYRYSSCDPVAINIRSRRACSVTACSLVSPRIAAHNTHKGYSWLMIMIVLPEYFDPISVIASNTLFLTSPNDSPFSGVLVNFSIASLKCA